MPALLVMCEIFCRSIIQGVSFNYHQRNVRSRSRLLRQSLGLGLVSKFGPGLGLGLGGYGLDYITDNLHNFDLRASSRYTEQFHNKNQNCLIAFPINLTVCVEKLGTVYSELQYCITPMCSRC